jgi:hypothetical protein
MRNGLPVVAATATEFKLEQVFFNVSIREQNGKNGLHKNGERAFK